MSRFLLFHPTGIATFRSLRIKQLHILPSSPIIIPSCPKERITLRLGGS